MHVVSSNDPNVHSLDCSARDDFSRFFDPNLVTARLYCFSEFRRPDGSPPSLQELIDWDKADQLYEKAQILRGVVETTIQEMDRLNESGPALPTEDSESQLKKLIQQSARCIVVESLWKDPSVDPPVEWTETDAEIHTRVQGYTRIFTNFDDIPDRDEIPEALVSAVRNLGREVWRHDRLFLKGPWRYFGAEGSTLTVLLSHVSALAEEHNAILMQKVLVGADHALAPAWLEAQAALKMRGSEDLEHLHIESVAYPKKTEEESDAQSLHGGTYNLHFNWWCYPPISQNGQIRLQRYQEHYDKLSLWLKQRVAITSAHILPMDSGSWLCISSEGDGVQLAALHPGASFYEMSPGASTKEKRGRKLRNIRKASELDLDFIRSLPDASLPGIYLNGELFWLSQQGSGTPQQNLEENLSLLASKLREGGKFIIRNTVARPEAECQVFIDLREDGDLVQLFEDYLRLSGRRAERRIPQRKGFARFECGLSTADDFLLKEEYRQDADWPREAVKLYPIATRSQIEEMGTETGLRLLNAHTEQSSYKVEQRWDHNIYLSRVGIDGKSSEALDYPPTNAYVVLEKVSEMDGVAIRVSSDAVVDDPSFLRISCYRHNHTGKIRETISVPGTTFDYIGVSEVDGRLMVWARDDYARPVLSVEDSSLNGDFNSPYRTEQVGMVLKEREILFWEKKLRERYGLDPDAVIELFPPTRYLAAPGLIDELVVSSAFNMPASVKPRVPLVNESGFFSAGRLVPIEATTLLWGSEAGCFASERLVRKVYELILDKGLSAGPWLGEKISLSPQTNPGLFVENLGDLLGTAQRRLEQDDPGNFAKLDNADLCFLEPHRASFDELRYRDGEEQIISVVKREYAVPAEFHSTMLIAAPMLRVQTSDGSFEDLIGLEIRNDDLPEIQQRLRVESLVSLPTFYLPKEIESFDEAIEHGRAGLKGQFGIETGLNWQVGQVFEVSPGMTPGRMLLVGYEVDARSLLDNPGMRLVRVKDMPAETSAMLCGNLITAAYRIPHALGYLR